MIAKAKIIIPANTPPYNDPVSTPVCSASKSCPVASTMIKSITKLTILIILDRYLTDT